MKITFKNIGFGSPKQNGAGKVEMTNFKPGQKIAFGLGVDVDGFDRNQKYPVLAKLWTNMGNNRNPTNFYEIPMQPTAPTDHHNLAFSAEVPIDRLGTYKVTALLSPDNGATWHYINDYGKQDVIVRPSQDVRPPARFAVAGWTDEETRRWLDNANSCSSCGG